jgi:hypothetical protein
MKAKTQTKMQIQTVTQMVTRIEGISSVRFPF